MIDNEYNNVDALGTAKFFTHIKNKKLSNDVLDMIYPYCKTLEQLDAIGYVYAKNRNFIKALEIALKTLPLAKTPEQMWDCRVNIIRCYLNTNNPNQALKYININKKLNPNDQPNLMDEAYALFLLNQKDDAEKILRELLKNPQSQDIFNRCMFNLGSYDLRNENFKDGIKNFLISGRTMNIWESFSFPNNYWDGKIIPDATILCAAEGGIGDEIINIRFCKKILDLGMKPVWYTTRQDLAKTFKRSGFNVITSLKDIDPSWYWCYSMLLPYYLDIDENDLWHGQYIYPSSIKQSIPKTIGIKISGNPEYDHDLARNLPLDLLLECIPEDYKIYSFHKDEKIKHPRIINWMDENTSWDETIDKIQKMEIIISSCTSLAHMAGAMNKEKTFIFSPILKYYIWGNEKQFSPWYSKNIMVFHQEKNKSWVEPFKKFKELKIL